MTKDDIIRMAIGSGMLAPQYRDHIEQLERFAFLVAAAEREACAELCNVIARRVESACGFQEGAEAATECAAAIRARTTQ